MKLRLPDFVTTAQDGGRLSVLRTGRFLPPGNTPGTHFCSRLSRPQGHSAIGRILRQLTPAGIEPATFRFVAQRLNHCATAVPNRNQYQGYLLGDKGGRCLGLRTLPPPCTDRLEIWEPQSSATQRACTGINFYPCGTNRWYVIPHFLHVFACK